MLEDLDTVDFVRTGEPGEVIIKIIDGGVTTDPEKFEELLKAKIAQAIYAVNDEQNFEASGRPTRLRIEVPHLIPRPPYSDDALYEISAPLDLPHPLDVSLVFKTTERRYNYPPEQT